ncbi:IS110 family transposase [Pseudonocardia oroxyli]|uniref:Transposase IS110-like N-terminal domain-containing protein n=1 Tax=Pseudonocardia oroxyli TaxID=366584 RepID=A0A1G7TG62_PSEOR|nr:transposase [Pseudonocardia oroxyli]SDG34181.1 hypothetical protein SAMN05216377_11120 [Pseudonocardia oroxyli]
MPPRSTDSAEFLGDREFPATRAGYVQLVGWLKSFGHVALVGVEGTGAYGAGLATALSEHRVQVVEVDQPDRRARRRQADVAIATVSTAVVTGRRTRPCTWRW